MAENEYIERKSIVDSIRKDFDFYYQIPIYLIDRDVQNIINRVNRVVQELPAADVAPVVHAEWVMIPVKGVARYRCGNIHCCRLMPFGCSPGELEFCPHCGARMDGGTEKPYKPGNNLLELYYKKFTETCE